MDVMALSLIAPFLAAVVSPEKLLSNEYFKLITNQFGLNIGSDADLIIYMSIFLIGLFFLKGIFGLFVQHYANYFIFYGRANFNGKLMQRYLLADWQFHKNNNSSYLDRNLRVSSQKAFACLSFLLRATIDLFFVIFAIALLAYAEGKLVLIASIFFIILLLIWYQFSGPLLSRIGKKSVSMQGESAKIIRENFDSIREIITFRAAHFFSDKYFQKENKVAGYGRTEALIGIMPAVFIEIIAISLLAGSCVVLVLSNLSLVDYIPVLGLFAIVILRLLPILMNLIRSIQHITYEYPALQLINNQISELDESYSHRTKNTDNPTNQLNFKYLELSNISFSYDDIEILRDFSLKVEKSDIIGISGPSGSGKSTILNLLLGLLTPQMGEIKLNGSPLLDDIYAWREIISFVPQEPILFDASIRENICFGNNNITDAKIWEVLKIVKLDALIRSERQGLDSIIGERGSNFSGGQKQRLSIARALIRNPSVIFLDEFTSALDREVEKELLSDLFAIPNLTIVLVSHSSSVIDSCKKRIDLI
jgi:ABC-type bacteriocin/lantibiotic exporter with double-glycine peptidase domain